MQPAWKFAIAGVVVYTFLCYLFNKVKNSFMFRPDIGNYQVPVETLQADIGLIVPNAKLREIDLKTPDGETINCLFAENPDSDKWVIYSHGNAGNIWIRDYTFKKYLPLASIIIYDYRGYGKSTGSPSEKGLVCDLETVWNYVTQDLGVSPSDITLFGESLGTGVTLQFARRMIQLKQDLASSIILLAGFSSIKQMCNAYLPSFLSHFLNNDFDSEGVIRKVDKHIPILILHSPYDDFVHIHHKDRLIDRCTGAEYVEIHGDHNNPVFPESAKKAIRDYIQKT